MSSGELFPDLKIVSSEARWPLTRTMLVSADRLPIPNPAAHRRNCLLLSKVVIKRVPGGIFRRRCLGFLTGGVESSTANCDCRKKMLQPVLSSRGVHARQSGSRALTAERFCCGQWQSRCNLLLCSSGGNYEKTSRCSYRFVRIIRLVGRRFDGLGVTARQAVRQRHIPSAMCILSWTGRGGHVGRPKSECRGPAIARGARSVGFATGTDRQERH